MCNGLFFATLKRRPLKKSIGAEAVFFAESKAFFPTRRFSPKKTPLAPKKNSPSDFRAKRERGRCGQLNYYVRFQKKLQAIPKQLGWLFHYNNV
jgi:hypothetical protein